MKRLLSIPLVLLFAIALVNCETTPSDAECVVSTECFSGEVCQDHYCVPMFPAVYSFTFDSASIDPADKNGGDWDAVLGVVSPPDPKVVVTIDGEIVFESSEISDTLSPVWNESTQPFQLTSDSEVSVYLYDVDTLSEEEIWSHHFEVPFCPDCIRAGVYGADPTDTVIDFGFLIDVH